MASSVRTALVIFVVFLCLHWSESLKCGPCKKSLCKTLVKSNCPHGIGKDACKCCDACLKGAGQKCGGKGITKGTCGKGLVCIGGHRSQGGTCVKKTSETVKCGPCKKSLCKKLVKSNCPHGIGKDACKCCDACLKGPGQKCGGKGITKGTCGKGLVCIGGNRSQGGTCVKRTLHRCFKKQNCRAANCGRAPKNCPHGSGKSKCGCCRVCLKGLGQPCGVHHSKFVPCGKRLTCKGEIMRRKVYRPGTCVWTSVSNCPCLTKCDPKRCREARGCRYGKEKPKCGCCTVCRKDYRQRCGSGIAVCKNRYVCVGSKLSSDKNGSCVFKSGICRLRTCPCRKRCKKGLCVRPKGCPNGFEVPKCGCCPICRQSAGKPCSGDIGACQRGYECQGDRVFANKKGFCVYKAGICKKRVRPCRYPINCRGIKLLPPIGCKHGSSRPSCSCVEVCLKDLNEPCGLRTGECRKGYYCRGFSIRKQGGILRYTQGRCRKRGGCKYDVGCVGIRCKNEQCKYGKAKPKCGCCQICRRDINEKCGDKHGVCRKGSYCTKQKVREINGKPVFSPGTCRQRGGCPFFLDCRQRYCPELDCIYGQARPKCSCCPVCLKDAGEDCGFKDGKCKKGYSCFGFRYSKGKYIPGFCRKRGSTCPCVKNCDQAYCYTPEYCEHGHTKPACGCCFECRKETGEQCGYRHGNCRLDDFCKHQGYKRAGGGECRLIPGICTRRRPNRCPCKLRCRVHCKRPRCPAGFATPLCGCCPKCLKGPGDVCGFKQGKCGSGYECKGQSYRRRNRNTCSFRPGICIRKRFNFRDAEHSPVVPPKRTDKQVSQASNERERNRRARNYGRHWYKLTSEPSEIDSNEDPYDYSDYSWERTRSPVRHRRWYCRRATCGPRRYCEYGYGVPPYKCCPVCLKGEGDHCGREGMPCGHGLLCRNEIKTYYWYRPGTCLPNRPPPCPDCEDVTCKPLTRRCLYGEGKDRCGCCRVCRQGYGQICGGFYNTYGHCGYDLVCQVRRRGEAGICIYRYRRYRR